MPSYDKDLRNKSWVRITWRFLKRTFVRARIYLVDDALVADCESGLRLSHSDATELADLLWTNDVTSEEVSMIDWHEDVERAPLTGHKI